MLPPDIYGPDFGILKGKTTSHEAQLEEELPLIITKQSEDQAMYLLQANDIMKNRSYRIIIYYVRLMSTIWIIT